MTKERAAYPSEEADKYIVRFPPGMRDQLKESAKANGRTMNAEIVARLEQTLKGDSSNALIVDQASQIWELRRQILSDHLAMAEALEALAPNEADHERVTEALRTAIGETRKDAAAAIKQMGAELSKRYGNDGLSIINELFERFTQDHEALTRKK